MKFFIDTANINEIREAQNYGILDGVTTNPSLMAKEKIKGEKNIIEHYKKICSVVDGDVSAEVISTDLDGIISCLLYTSPSPRDRSISRMPSSA